MMLPSWRRRGCGLLPPLGYQPFASVEWVSKQQLIIVIDSLWVLQFCFVIRPNGGNPEVSKVQIMIPRILTEEDRRERTAERHVKNLAKPDIAKQD